MTAFAASRKRSRRAFGRVDQARGRVCGIAPGSNRAASTVLRHWRTLLVDALIDPCILFAVCVV
ncbi:hypothetical protein CCR95_14775 [Thiocystis minor]|nr:hypothetical protein [Thiocystis minor]